MKFRPAKKSDFSEIMRLYEQLWSPGKIVPKNMKKLKKAWHKIIKANYDYELVLEKNNKLIGHVTLRIIPEFWLKDKMGLIDDVVIDKDYRGQGLADKMMKEIKKIAKKKKVKTLVLYTEDYRPKAIKLYNRLKYQKLDKIWYKKEI
ncbi:MAG: GNAT family N-acetyltransferase [Patescibacteria group bacterium]|nr:GNAT family N-acetyltransferase [Patescibacteria group bacterium]